MKTSSNSLLSALAAAFQLIVGVGANAQTVTFPNANLKAVVREALAKPSGDIAEEDMLSLTSLDAGETPLSSLPDLSPLANLSVFMMAGSQITGLSALTSLPSLWWLSLQGNKLAEIGPLLDCALLGYVNLKENFLDTTTCSAAWGVIANLLVARSVQVEYDPQNPIIVVSRPANRSASVGDDVEFSVSATGGTPGIAGYRWQKNGTDLADDTRISGSGSDSLQITGVTADDAGLYRVRLWDDWVATNSATAELKAITNVVFADPKPEEAVLEIWTSTNLTTWTSAGYVTNTAGSTTFTDSSAGTKQKFYRAQLLP